ncbi:MAG: flagellar motor protein MotD [Gammaproteobacteria bacterium]|nr:flagellar motor protein MotD [Gammaproteobacteria bacterium]MDH5777386.1 flagellar motor protein MotD [Gammaproteobacteria bacterium]
MRRKLDEDTEDTGRWMVSYADFITLLFAFFVVMYAISSVNEGKYKVLADSMLRTFKQHEQTDKMIQIGKQPTALVAERQPRTQEKELEKQRKYENKKNKKMAKIADQVVANLKPLVDKKLIKVDHTENWVKVEINTSILFDTGSSQLENDADEPLLSLAKVLKPLANPVQVEGHTDDRPIKTRVYPSNWELSAARAASVVHLFSKHGVKPDRMTAIGYGQYRPLASNKTSKGRRHNRRVVIVILGDQNERRVLDIGQKMNNSSDRR